MICVCPYTGLEAGGESWRDNLGKDILNENSMTRMEECYLGPEDSEYEGGLSPFTYLDKSMVIGSFVPKRMLVYLGGKQVLLEEGGILASRAGSSGVQVMVVQEPSGIHLWPMFANDLVEDINVRQNAVDKLVEFVSSIYYSEAKHKRK
jgi:acetyl esterase/lipase